MDLIFAEFLLSEKVLQNVLFINLPEHQPRRQNTLLSRSRFQEFVRSSSRIINRRDSLHANSSA